MAIFCSTIIPTIGRTSLARAVESVLQQELTGESFEIIVVNDSGAPLPPAAWQKAANVCVAQTRHRERSVARNTGAAMARGRFLHFLDDDDWLEPGALQHLANLAQDTSAAWLYGSTRTLDRQGKPLLELHHGFQGNCFLPAMAGEWIPLQSSLIRAEAFFALGGFSPFLCGPEDVDLVRRMALRYEFAGSDRIVATMLLGETGSTTNWRQHPIQSRRAREQILNEPDAYSRLRSSLLVQTTGSRAAWHGRIVRIYLTSAIWNLAHRRPWTALSRAGYAAASFGGAGRRVFSYKFWRAGSRPYASYTFARGISGTKRGQDSG